MNRATAPRTERHLSIVRDEIAAAVDRLDTRIDAPPPPPPLSPYASAINVGKLERFADPTRHECVGYVLHLLGAKRVTVIMPVELDDDDMFDAVSNLADVVLAKCEPPPTDD